MKLRNGSRFEIDVDADEQVTVQITQSIGIQDLVNYSQNGGITPGVLSVKTPCQITPGTSGNLAVTAHFADANGGSFTVQATGSKGGDTSTFKYTQAGDPFKVLVYTFFV